HRRRRGVERIDHRPQRHGQQGDVERHQHLRQEQAYHRPPGGALDLIRRRSGVGCHSVRPFSSPVVSSPVAASSAAALPPSPGPAPLTAPSSNVSTCPRPPCTDEANRFRPSARERYAVARWPRTLLPAGSSRGEKVPI